MPSLRFLPDLVLQLLTLAVSLWMLHKWRISLLLRAILQAGCVLIPAAALVILAEAAGVERAVRLLWIPGLSMTWCVVFCMGLILRGVLLAMVHVAKRFVAEENQAWTIGLPGSRKASAEAAPAQEVDLPRRKLLTAAADATLVIPAVAFARGIIVNRRQFRLVKVDLPIPNLHPDLDGLRFVQLSDIHLSPFLSRADLAYCVDLANEPNAHAAFVTGDLITGVHDSIGDCLDELRRLRTDAGVFGCNGNHEMYIEAEGYTAEQAARRGMHFLRRERTSLRFGNASINLAGVDHQNSARGYLKGADALRQPADLNLLLSHNPAVFPQAAQQGWDLTLAGHLHGGQVNLELANWGPAGGLNIARIRSPYVYGSYRIGARSIYVTRGIGTIGMPVRLGAPPEVALIRLRRA